MKTTIGKQIIFINEDDILYGNNTYLQGRFSIDKKDKEQGYVSDMWYDCDHIKLGGEQGRGAFEFIKHENKSKIYLIGRNDWQEYADAISIVMWWLNAIENEVEINNNWSDWNTVKQGVAYRGGRGYCYTLYAKELIAN